MGVRGGSGYAPLVGSVARLDRGPTAIQEIRETFMGPVMNATFGDGLLDLHNQTGVTNAAAVENGGVMSITTDTSANRSPQFNFHAPLLFTTGTTHVVWGRFKLGDVSELLFAMGFVDDGDTEYLGDPDGQDSVALYTSAADGILDGIVCVDASNKTEVTGLNTAFEDDEWFNCGIVVHGRSLVEFFVNGKLVSTPAVTNLPVATTGMHAFFQFDDTTTSANVAYVDDFYYACYGAGPTPN